MAIIFSLLLQDILKSDKPDEKMLALLANFEGDTEEAALQNILKEVQESAKGDFSESRYFGQLRNLDIKFMEAMETITKYFKEEKILTSARESKQEDLKESKKGNLRKLLQLLVK